MIDLQTRQTESTRETTQNASANANANAVNAAADRPSETVDSTSRSPESLHELSLHVPSITNSPHCAPARTTHSAPLSKPAAPPRVRSMVRTDAWAVPASANWSRARSTVRQVARGTRAVDWALPF